MNCRDGICEVDLNYDSTRPPNTSITFEVQHLGNWIQLGYYDNNLLINKPPLLPLRVTFVGTTDEMPGIGVASNSRQFTSRPADHYVHISTARTMPQAQTVNTVYCDFRLEQWLGPPTHTFTPRLLTGAGYTSIAHAVAD